MQYIKDYFAKRKAKKAKRKDHIKFLGLKKPPLPSVKVLGKKLKGIVDQIVKIRDKRAAGGKCVVCLKNDAELVYHVIPASESYLLKYDVLNLAYACSYCNFMELRNRSYYASVVHERVFGAERMNYLRNMVIKEKYSRSIGEIIKWGRSEFKQAIDIAEKCLSEILTGAK